MAIDVAAGERDLLRSMRWFGGFFCCRTEDVFVFRIPHQTQNCKCSPSLRGVSSLFVASSNTEELFILIACSFQFFPWFTFSVITKKSASLHS